MNGSKCWVAGYGVQDSFVEARIFGTKKSIGVYYLDRLYCTEYRKSSDSRENILPIELRDESYFVTYYVTYSSKQKPDRIRIEISTSG